MQKIIFSISFFFFTCFCQAQLIPSAKDTTLEPEIKLTDAIVEGRVISSTGFQKVKGQTYTSAQIKVTKIFKGDISDTLITIVFEGGIYGDRAAIVHDGFQVSEGQEGVFLLKNNKSTIKLEPNILSFLPIGFINYNNNIHRANFYNITYDNLEIELFQRIETATGQKRKVLGPNMFERPSKRPTERK